MKIDLPYGRGTRRIEVPDARLAGIVRGTLEEYVPGADGAALVRGAMASPVGSVPLRELARGARRVVVIISDHTRPVPSRVILPEMLREIRRGNPDAEVTLLVATGCHRGTTKEELIDKCSAQIVASERIVIHDCDDTASLVSCGTLPSGGELIVNRLAAEADLLVAEGFIEPHFFAGFSGGRKSVLPGIAARRTVMYNHNAAFIAHPAARAGELDENPIHRDMLWAARRLNLAFIVNVVVNARHEVVAAFAGDCAAAHREGVSFLSSLCCLPVQTAPIVVTTNNGHPLDQNIYQAVKGMSTAEALTPEGGVIIMYAACTDGHGGEGFRRFFRENPDPRALLSAFARIPADETLPDQWQAQILARILAKRAVILVSESSPALVRAFGIHPAWDFTEALSQADEICRENGFGADAPVLVVPEGISVIAV